MRSPDEIIGLIRDYRSPKQASVQFDADSILGIGAGRLILELDEETVLKASPNPMGDEQNRCEVEIWNNVPDAGRTHLAPIIAYADDYSWVKMKRVDDAEDTYEAFANEKEERIRDILAGYGVTLHEVEVGYYNGNLVAFDYGSAEM